MGLTGPAQRGNRMRLLVIDGQGGGVGKSLIAAVKRLAPEQAVIAAGTNAQATAAMLRAGADLGATEMCIRDRLEAMLRERVPELGEIQTNYVGPVIGAHCGPGTVAICFFGKERPC